MTETVEIELGQTGIARYTLKAHFSGQKLLFMDHYAFWLNPITAAGVTSAVESEMIPPNWRVDHDSNTPVSSRHC